VDAGLVLSLHGMGNTTIPVGAPECGIKGDGLGQGSDGLIQLADLRGGEASGVVGIPIGKVEAR